MITKRCPRCQQTRPTSEFGISRSRPDGLQGYCKNCRSGPPAPPRPPRRRPTTAPATMAAMYARERRARVRAVWVEDVDRAIVWDRDGGICYLCGLPADPARWDLDHVAPLCHGGEHSYANTAVTHPSCNRSKNGTSWPDVRFNPTA